MDRYGHLLDRSYSDVGDMLERAWAASGPASAEGANGAAAFRDGAAALAEVPASEAAYRNHAEPRDLSGVAVNRRL